MILIERGITPFGTFGDIFVNGEFICHSLEREWHDNTPFFSCIPDGDYIAEPYNSPKYGKCYIIHNEQVHNVDNFVDNNNPTVVKFKNSEGLRWGILLHSANLPSQLAGCIAPVDKFQYMNLGHASGTGGTNSKASLNKLMKVLDNRTHKITFRTKVAQ